MKPQVWVRRWYRKGEYGHDFTYSYFVFESTLLYPKEKKIKLTTSAPGEKFGLKRKFGNVYVLEKESKIWNRKCSRLEISNASISPSYIQLSNSAHHLFLITLHASYMVILACTIDPCYSWIPYFQFTYLPKFTCNHPVNMHAVFMAIC